MLSYNTGCILLIRLNCVSLFYRTCVVTGTLYGDDDRTCICEVVLRIGYAVITIKNENCFSNIYGYFGLLLLCIIECIGRNAYVICGENQSCNLICERCNLTFNYYVRCCG